MDFSKSKLRLFVMTQRLQDLDKNNINLLHSKNNDNGIEEQEVEVKVIPNSIELPSVSQEELDKAKSDVDNEKKTIQESMNNSSPVVKGKNLKYIS